MTYQSKPLTNIGEIRHRRNETITYRNGIFKGDKKVAEVQSTDKRLLTLLTNQSLTTLNGQPQTERATAETES